MLFFFFKQKTAYEMRISDWSSDVFSSDLVANDFFDALPIHQYVRTTGGWRELMVERIDGELAPVAGDIPADDAIPVPLRGERAGTIVETAPTAAAIMQRCAFRLARQGGAMLAIDYGYSGPAAGGT